MKKLTKEQEKKIDELIMELIRAQHFETSNPFSSVFSGGTEEAKEDLKSYLDEIFNH